MKININDNPLKPYASIPEFWNGEMIKYSNETEIYDLGFRDLLIPEIDHTTEKLGELIYDEANDVGTYEVLQKTEQEIQNEIIQQAQSDQEAAVQNLLKKKLIDELQLEEDTETILQNQSAYPLFVPNGELVLAGTKLQDLNNDNVLTLYRCNQDILATEQFRPRLAVYAYDEIKMGGNYQIWQQPQAHDPYNTGDIVWYPDEGTTLYISTIDGNVHAPGVVEGAWEIYNP